MSAFVVATFYKFVSLADYRDMRQPILQHCQELGIRGTILLAQEGINSTIAGTQIAIDALLSELHSDPRLCDMEAKVSYVDFMPFQRMKVRLKQEIVTMRVPEVNPLEQVGEYVVPEAWNDLISMPDVRVIDVRNDFEVRVGSFQNAENPETASFHGFPQYVAEQLDPEKDKKVAMFCTGGIRCEKATSYLLSRGFEEVYHLKGGILKYLEVIPPEQSLWEGECFVFDERVSLDHNLNTGEAHFCPTCNTLLAGDEDCSTCGGD